VIKMNGINRNRLIGFDIEAVSPEEAKLYSRYLEILCLINNHIPKHIFDFKNKMIVKKLNIEMNEILDKLTASGFWNRVQSVS
jgi:hypothetical protein